MTTTPRHRAPGRTRTPWTLTGNGYRTAALATTVMLATGTLTPAVTGAAWTDSAQTQSTVAAAHWASRLCVIQSEENRPEVGVFSIGSSASLGNEGWVGIVDARSATTLAQLRAFDCSVVVIAGEAWGVKPERRDLATAWFNAGGSVMTTGNDTGFPTYPMPLLIESVGTAVADYPYGGSVPASSEVLASVSPAYPTWVPGTEYALDPNGGPVTKPAAGATCVATVAGHPEWCAAIVRTDPKSGGRWVHLHTLIGSRELPGEVPGANAALQWLSTGRD